MEEPPDLAPTQLLADDCGSACTVTGRFDAMDKTVAQIDASVGVINDRVGDLDRKVDFLTSTTTLIAQQVGIKEDELPIMRGPDKP